eukprot:2523945-Rhodomonas_salina.2
MPGQTEARGQETCHCEIKQRQQCISDKISVQPVPGNGCVRFISQHEEDQDWVIGACVGKLLLALRW